MKNIIPLLFHEEKAPAAETHALQELLYIIRIIP